MFRAAGAEEMARDLSAAEAAVCRRGVVQPRPELGRWAAELSGLLAGNAAKAAREQLTLIRIFEQLRGRGYPARR
jgi:hypothetical protein